MTKRKTLYVSDLDGTLLNGSSVLSDYTIKTLNGVIADGAMFTIATARTPATVVPIMERLKTDLPYIVMAGCALWNNDDKKYISARTINSELLPQLTDIFNRHGNNPFVYHRSGNKIIVNHTEKMSDAERKFISPRISTPYKSLQTVGDDELSDYRDDVMLIFSMGSFSELRMIADDIDAAGIPCSYHCYQDIFDNEQGFIDLYKENTTKAAAIKELAKKVGAERIVVFGDNLNDISMMQIADWSVAVENAFPDVKETANEVIGTNTDDSVAKWIRQDFYK